MGHFFQVAYSQLDGIIPGFAASSNFEDSKLSTLTTRNCFSLQGPQLSGIVITRTCVTYFCLDEIRFLCSAHGPWIAKCKDAPRPLTTIRGRRTTKDDYGWISLQRLAWGRNNPMAHGSPSVRTPPGPLPQSEAEGRRSRRRTTTFN